jgi:hypothetical protein
MHGFGISYRMAKRIVGTIEAGALRQPEPRIGCLLHHGATGNRGIHPCRKRRSAEQCRDDAAEQGDAQEPSRGYARCHD